MFSTNRLPIVIVSLAVIACLPALVLAVPATIDLQVVGQPRVVQGAAADLFAFVQNSAAPGAEDLNFSIEFAYPYGTSVLNNNVRIAGAGFGVPFSGPFDSTQVALGTHTTNVTVTDPNATNSPQVASFETTVLTHAVPIFYVQVFGETPQLIAEPEIAPEQFAATGGGETFAARSTAVNDPPVPTAKLDLDEIIVTGDDQIRIEYLSSAGSPQTREQFVDSFENLTEIHEASGLANIDIEDFLTYEQFGRSFDIYVDTSTPGHFSKELTFLFSDEDIPGGSAPASVSLTFRYAATVVPEPNASLLVGLAVFVLTAVRKPVDKTIS